MHALLNNNKAAVTHGHIHPVVDKLFAIMQKKQTNLAVAADVRTQKELLDLVDQIGSEICILKTHMDIIDDFDWSLIKQLKIRAQRYNFLICEDRKFADIGSTVQAQYMGGVHRIADWADIIIVHAIAGEPIIDALKSCKQDCAILLIAELSCKGNLINKTYTQTVVDVAEKRNDVVIGIIAQQATLNTPHQIKCTPGIHLAINKDSLGQQYNTPEHVITDLFTDIIIVGRGIYKADNPKKAAQAYKDAAWTAYKHRSAVQSVGCDEPSVQGGT